MRIHNSGVYGASMRAAAVNRISAEAPDEGLAVLVEVIVCGDRVR